MAWCVLQIFAIVLFRKILGYINCMINARSSCALPIQDAPTRTVIKNHARKYEYVNVKCSALTVSIGIDVWVRARVANLKQQLSQMSIVETLLPTGMF